MRQSELKLKKLTLSRDGEDRSHRNPARGTPQVPPVDVTLNLHMICDRAIPLSGTRHLSREMCTCVRPKVTFTVLFIANTGNLNVHPQQSGQTVLYSCGQTPTATRTNPLPHTTVWLSLTKLSESSRNKRACCRIPLTGRSQTGKTT